MLGITRYISSNKKSEEIEEHVAATNRYYFALQSIVLTPKTVHSASKIRFYIKQYLDQLLSMDQKHEF